MKKKAFLCVIGDSLYDADIVLNGSGDKGVVLNCSPLDSKWTPKALAAPPVVLHNNGNGINVLFDDGKSIYLDYSQVAELRAALHIEDNLDNRPTKFKKYELKWENK